MTAAGGSRNRDTVPRWRSLERTVLAGELEPLRPRPPGPSSPLDVTEQLEAFERQPGLYTAGDLLSAAATSGARLACADPASEYVLQSPLAGPVVTALALRQLGEEADAKVPMSEGTPGSRIASLRQLLRARPHNPLRWSDLALEHTTIGLHERATREMKTALSLAPTNRLVLRSATRLHLLRGDPQRAQVLLEGQGDPDDPWIAAAALSVGAQMEHLGSLRHHRWLLEHAGLEPRHTSELASELATVEFRAGNDRRARKYMRQALVHPTENSLAQAEWAAANGMAIRLEEAGSLPTERFEAKALRAFRAVDFEAALRSGLLWQEDQRFDPGPAAFVSFVAAMGLEDHDTAIRATRLGLVANPDEVILRNNLAFSLASSDRALEAEAELARLPSTIPDPRRAAVIEATRGLILFALGQPDAGAERYLAAIRRLERLGEGDLAALAALRWTREEQRASSTIGVEFASGEARRLSRRSTSDVVQALRGRVMDTPSQGKGAQKAR